MGVVYSATDLELERQVALKVISPALASDPSFEPVELWNSEVAPVYGLNSLSDEGDI